MTTPDPKDALLGALAKHGFGARLTPAQALKRGVCIKCEQPALAKCYSDAGRREYAISALCESCYDDLFDDGDAGFVGFIGHDA